MGGSQRCQAPGCGRFIRAGARFCGRHSPAATTGAPPNDEAATAHARFLERLERGEYAELFDAQVREVMRQAAAAMREQGLSEEIGALRVVLSRLIREEHDLAALTANVTKVASVAAQVARAQRAIGGDAATGLTEAVTQILAELDAG